MRWRFAMAVALLQVAVLASMAIQREWVLHTGRTVFLRTTPVDPRDPFRGDYIRLDYVISHVRTNAMQGGLPAAMATAQTPRRDTRVYAALGAAADGTAHLDALTDRRPGTNLFIRGRTQARYSQPALTVRYGIEALFVPQGKGNMLDDRRRRDGIQVPLEMQVALGRNGMAVLTGAHRWGPLGIGVSLESVTNAPAGATSSRGRVEVKGATVELMNASSNALAIVDLPGGRSLILDNDEIREWGNSDWVWVGAGTPCPPPADRDVHVLQPGETYAIRVDFTAPEWRVRSADGKTNTLGELNWGSMFRLTYRPPPPEASRDLGQAGLVWHGELMSRAFGGGRID